MLIKYFLLIGLLLTLIYACGEKYSCQHSIGMRLAFVSFTKEETDTIMVKRFVKGSNFSQAIDSALVDTSLIKYQQRGDTLFPAELHVQTLFSPLFDYQVTVPAENKTYSISDITEEEKIMKRGFLSNTKESCYNPIRAYTLNGERKTVLPNREVIYLDY